MSALESRRPPEPVEDLARHSGVVETKKKNEQLTPAERVKRSLVYSGILGRNLESILEGERPKAEVEKMREISMVLRRGEELGRIDVSGDQKGRNSIDIRHYVLENDPSAEYVVAFVKSEGGQRVLDYDEVTQTVTARQAIYQEKPGSDGAEFVQSLIEQTPDMTTNPEVMLMQTSWLEVPSSLESMAKHYRVDIQDVPRPNQKELTHRNFIARDQPVRAERTAFLQAEFYGLGGVPVTELRANEGVVDAQGRKVTELCSVQQMARSFDKDRPMEPLSSKLMDELEATGPAHPLAESFMRAAVKHTLFGQTDGNPGGLLAPRDFSMEEGIVPGASIDSIDYGYAYPPASRTEDVKDVSGRVWSLDVLSHGHLSYAQYIIEEKPDWKLDEAPRSVMRARVEACRAWMNRFDQDPDATDLDDMNKEVAFLLNSFLFLRGHHLTKSEKKRAALLKIAKRDMRGQLNMVDYNVENGRPPDLKLVGLSNNLFYDLLKQRMKEKKAQAEVEEATSTQVVKNPGRAKPKIKDIDFTSDTIAASNPFAK